MLNRWIPAALCAALLLAVTFPAAAQQSADDMKRLIDEVAGLNRSLDRLAAMLEQMMFQQEVDLLLKRIELKERRLEPMAGHLRSLQREYDGRKTEIKHYQEMLEQAERDVSDELRQGRGDMVEESEAQQMVKELERALTVETAAIEGLERRIRELEDALAEGREEVLILDEQLREMMGQ
jgi:predicted RNase H-like nuclease (RuvC/YqgF family)